MSEEQIIFEDHPLQKVLDSLYIQSYRLVPANRLAILEEEFITPEEVGKFYLEYHPSLASLVIPTYQELSEDLPAAEFLLGLPQEFLEEYHNYLARIASLSSATSGFEILDADQARTEAHNKLALILKEFFAIPSFEVARALVKVLLIESEVESPGEVVASIDRRLGALYRAKN
ncbi:hypothetical protein GW755_02090 [bacterium]|nr:hypothetical protein [bacterium]